MDVDMMLLFPANVLLHVWSYEKYDGTLSTGAVFKKTS